MIDPTWVEVARRSIGVRELAGAPTAPVIAGWLQKLGAWWKDDETPWCGTACAAWLTEAGLTPPKTWYRARDWAAWGDALPAPMLGAIVVFERVGGGHVGIVVGIDVAGRLMVLGGNQGDRVCIAPFDRGRAVAFRWPPGAPSWATAAVAPPLMVSASASSANEA